MRPPSRALALLLSVSLTSAPALALAPKRPPATAPKKTPKTPPTAPTPPPVAPPSGPTPLADSLTGSAKTDYEAAKALFTTNDYAGALAKYRSAHEASKDPRVLWNMAACEKNLHHYVSAKKLLERLLEGDKALVTAQDMTAAREQLAQVDALVGKVAVTVSEGGAKIVVDGEEVGTSPLGDKILLDPGEHKLEVTRQGAVKHAKPLIVASGEMAVLVEMTLEPRDGKLTVQAGAKDTIHIDGKVVGVGSFSGPLAAGKHALDVSAEGMKDYQTEVEIQERQARSLHVSLEPNKEPPKGVPVWMWVAGGAVVAVGATTAVIVATRKDTVTPSTGTPGTIGTGSVRLPFAR